MEDIGLGIAVGICGVVCAGVFAAFTISDKISEKKKCPQCGSRRTSKIDEDLLSFEEKEEMRLRKYQDDVTCEDKDGNTVYGTASRGVREPAIVSYLTYNVKYQCKKCKNVFYEKDYRESVEWKWND